MPVTVTATEVLALKGVAARNAVYQMTDPDEVRTLLDRDKRKLITTAATSRLAKLNRLAATLEKGWPCSRCGTVGVHGMRKCKRTRVDGSFKVWVRRQPRCGPCRNIKKEKTR